MGAQVITKSGHLETYTDSNAVSPLLPEVSAYFADITIGAGAYGSDTAQHFADLCNQVAALTTALKARNIISAT